jgi:uncharacterized protein
MSITRRNFLRSAGAVTLGFTGLHRLLAAAPLAPGSIRLIDRFGPLHPDPNGLMDLPNGFSYSIISRTGDAMSDGFVVPAAPDGMAAFAGPQGLTILVRNHEVSSDSGGERGAFGATNEHASRLTAEQFYDPGFNGQPRLGGTTTVVYDTRKQEVVRQYLSLAGTIRNCAGGPTPWNTWVTCEETIERANATCARDHGYNFEVPASAEPKLAEPVPLKDMGRFNHEAIAVDPASGIVYETEDRSDGLIYRFIPDEPGKLQAGGRLQALAVVDRPGLDTRNWGAIRMVDPGKPLTVQWIDLDDVESPEDDLRYRGFASGAARFARGEGMWYGRGAIYFACTNGGYANKGQIWKYVPSPNEGKPEESRQPGRLELFVEPNDGTLVENADNLTMAPWGDLIVAEDGSEDQFLIGVTPEGEVYKFARNTLNTSEWAGATYSPDGSTLFVNIQNPGITLAITGPWTV